jgi:hypothetical protein
MVSIGTGKARAETYVAEMARIVRMELRFFIAARFVEGEPWGSKSNWI